jgi:hypothetical protein
MRPIPVENGRSSVSSARQSHIEQLIRISDLDQGSMLPVAGFPPIAIFEESIQAQPLCSSNNTVVTAFERSDFHNSLTRNQYRAHSSAAAGSL